MAPYLREPVHGNAGTVAQGWRTDTYRALTAGAPSKIHIMTVDYRGYGKSTGSPTEAGLVIDGVSLIKYAMEVARIPPERIVIVGQSLGSAVATAVAEHFAVYDAVEFKCLILCAAFSDVPTLMSTYAIAGFIPILSPLRPYPFLSQFFARHIQETWLTFERLANLVRISRNVNVHLIHAKNDYDIPWSHSDTLFHAAANATSAKGLTFKQIEAVKMKNDFGESGRTNIWKTVQEDGGRKYIRQDIVKYGGNFCTTFERQSVPAVAHRSSRSQPYCYVFSSGQGSLQCILHGKSEPVIGVPVAHGDAEHLVTKYYFRHGKLFLSSSTSVRDHPDQTTVILLLHLGDHHDGQSRDCLPTPCPILLMSRASQIPALSLSISSQPAKTSQTRKTNISR